jgi:tRNA splicing endonuclease
MGKISGPYFLEDNPEQMEKLRLICAGVEEEGVQKLPLLEAAYFQGKKVIESGRSSEELVKLASKKDPLAHEKFRVLVHLREAGFIVRMGDGEEEFFRVYKKGIRVGEDRTEMVMRVLKEGEKPSLEADVVEASKMRKELVYAFVGKDGIGFFKAYRAGFE